MDNSKDNICCSTDYLFEAKPCKKKRETGWTLCSRHLQEWFNERWRRL